MELKRYTIDGTIDLVKIAIKRLRTYEGIALSMSPQGYYVAYSGGKDSDCIRILCELANVKHELWHNHTTVDAPETVRYVRNIPNINISYPNISMWRLIVRKGMPPTQIVRYCCRDLKERNGDGRFVVTGVRKSESVNRAAREPVEIKGKTKKSKKMFVHDNDETKTSLYNCMAKSTLILNPIIEWDDNDVWDFLRYCGCKSNPLYQCGYKRIGCVGCPMATVKRRHIDFENNPKYKDMYIRAFDKMLKHGVESGKQYHDWADGNQVFDWWISKKAIPKEIEGQLNFDDYD